MSRNMKRSWTQDQSERPQESAAMEKVKMLEKTLSLFRAEVDVKLNILQEILSKRNEQIAEQEKLFARERSLYETLLGHWKKAPELAVTRMSMDLSGQVTRDDGLSNSSGSDEEDPENNNPEYLGATRKKSKSSLRRQRKSSRGILKNTVQGEFEEDETVVDQDTTHNSQSGCGNVSDKLSVQLKQEVGAMDNEEVELEEKDPCSHPDWEAGGSGLRSHVNSGRKTCEDDGTKTGTLEFIKSSYGSLLLVHQGFVFRKKRTRGLSSYWSCVKGGKTETCKARCTTYNDQSVTMTGVHNHFLDPFELEERQRKAEKREKTYYSLQNSLAGTSGFLFGPSA